MSYLDTHGLTTLWNKIKTYISNYHDTTKQNTLVSGTNIKTVNSNSLLGSGNVSVGTYSKPSSGIPKTDLASAVQTSLGKADTALQSAPVTSVNSKTGAVSLSASDVGAAATSHTHVKSEITDFPTLATVATSGSYNDLSNKPVIDASLSSTSTNAVQNKIINDALSNKMDKVSGKGLSTNDFTDSYKRTVDFCVNYVTVDGVTQTVRDKVVELDLSAYTKKTDLGRFAVGTITPYAGIIDGSHQPPFGWLLCDGSAVSRTTYSALFSVIGITYGEGDGSTTFNLPDLRGSTTFGVKSNDDDFTLGYSGGSKTHTPSGTNSGGAVQRHTLTAAESGVPAHTHPATIELTAKALASGTTYSRANNGGTAYSDIINVNNNTAKNATSAHTHGFTQPTFTGVEQNTMPPYTTVNYIICYKELVGNGNGAAASWGNIEGTIGAQTDLQNALDSKVDKTSFIPNTCVEIYGTVDENITISTMDTYYIPFTSGKWSYRGVSEDGHAGTQVVPFWATLSDLNSTAKITIQSRGYYKVDYQLYFYDSFTANDLVIACVLYNNSSSQSGSGFLRRSSGRTDTTTPYITIGGSCMVWCEIGDTLTLGGTNGTGGRGTIRKNNASRMLVTKMA